MLSSMSLLSQPPWLDFTKLFLGREQATSFAASKDFSSYRLCVWSLVITPFWSCRRPRQVTQPNNRMSNNRIGGLGGFLPLKVSFGGLRNSVTILICYESRDNIEIKGMVVVRQHCIFMQSCARVFVEIFTNLLSSSIVGTWGVEGSGH